MHRIASKIIKGVRPELYVPLLEFLISMTHEEKKTFKLELKDGEPCITIRHRNKVLTTRLSKFLEGDTPRKYVEILRQ